MNRRGTTRWFSWTRLVCLAGTVALLWLVFRKIEFATLGESLQRTSLGWSCAAFLVYGLALALQANRWHLALVAVEQAVHSLASWRLAMIGHFFFTVFFGMAGGDAAKSAFYARWFRFPLPEVLAAAPLDRGLSLAGAILLAVFTWVLAAVSGGLDSLGNVPLQSPGFWVLLGIGLILVAIVAIVFWRPSGDGAVVRLVRTLREGGCRLLLSLELAGTGLAVATAGHLALSAVFALNLYAVLGSDVPWSQLSWTIPAITTISCLPFTVAGAGVREMAAISLLGLYAVPAAECVVASMLTMLHKLAWAGVGAGILWREQSVQETGMEVRPSNDTSLLVLSDAGEATRFFRAVNDTRAELIVWSEDKAGIQEETLSRIRAAMRDRSVVGGIVPSHVGSGLLGSIDPRWLLRQCRRPLAGESLVWFARREALLLLQSTEQGTTFCARGWLRRLRRQGRVLKL